MILAVSILFCLLCFAGGILYGLLPLRQDDQTRAQKTAVDVDGIVVVALVVILILLNADIASWIAIACVAAGFGVGRIPALRKWAEDTWIFFERPAATKSKRPHARKQTRKTTRKSH